ncbi:thiamine-binding protein [Aerococcus urinaeequi]|uniref:thiamine-binding protein n=1 Tax=Aerococcus urinaeequi TaxID=51665 RepID=UPI003D6BF55E
MNLLIAVSFKAIGSKEADEVHREEVIRIIKESELSYLEHDLFIEIEGPYDEVMETVKKSAYKLAEKDIRVVITMKGDIRPGVGNNMTEKINRINTQLEKE